MDIATFFETLAGKWFSQRTTHFLGSQTSRAGQSNLLIEYLPPSDPAVVKLCKELDQNVSLAACGLRIEQEGRMDGDSRSQQSTTLMVVLQAQPGTPGPLLIQGPKPSLVGHYSFDDGVLSLTTPTPAGTAEERLWFVNPNLRMRTSTLSGPAGVELTSFCSEIRMGLSRPPQEA